jgi:hypothetical protein
MPVSVPNPYSGEDVDTCSVSFAAQQQMAGGVGSPQTEGDFTKSKLLGEWGVIKAKLAKGEIPTGTKVLTYTHPNTGSRGYLFTKGKTLYQKAYTQSGKPSVAVQADPSLGESFIKSKVLVASIPQTVAAKPKPEVDPLKALTKQDMIALKATASKGQVVAITEDEQYKVVYEGADGFELLQKSEYGYVVMNTSQSGNIMGAHMNATGKDFFKPDADGKAPKVAPPPLSPPQVKPKVGKPEWISLKDAGVLEPGSEFYYHGSTKSDFLLKGIRVVVKANPDGGPTSRILVNKETGVKIDQQATNSAKWWVSKIQEEEPAPQPVAAPTPAAPVNAGSDSVGSMSHEDVAAMFVKIKDDLAKEKGLNIKGANPQLDQEVFKAIGEATGYTPAEIKGKIDAYKAAGNKLSALKKKVLAGTKQVPTGKPTQKPAAPSAPLVGGSGGGSGDPKPHGVPTVATPNLAKQVKIEVKEMVEADPGKVYSDEDVAAAYIIAKDQIVASNLNGWTLYTKNDKMDALIAYQVELKTGLTAEQQKVAIANYLASGKKLSVLKKQLIKQGAFEAKADTLKKSGAAKTQADKEKEAEAKAEAGYTPTPTPATGTPPTDTGKPAPKRVVAEAQEAGDITKIPDSVKAEVFQQFKNTGSKSWLSSGPGENYEGLRAAQAAMKAKGRELTLLQVIRIADEQGAKKAGVENGKLFEKQVATWLTTPEGTKYVKGKEKELAAKAEKAAKEAKAKAEAEEAAKKLAGNQPPLPADSAQYEPWTLDKAKRISEQWLKARPWSDKEKRDLKYYTSSAYSEMNGYLRGIRSTVSARAKTAIDGAKKGMRPTTEPILVARGTGLDQFKEIGLRHGSGDLAFGLTGKTFKDEGFVSTSAGGTAAFSREAQLEIECPVGTPMAYVAPISNFPHENEMLLQAGMEYKVLNVRKVGGKYVIRVRVVNWPGKAS